MKYIIPLAIAAFPAIAGAQASGEGIIRLVDLTGVIVSRLIPVIIGIAVLVFIWGILKYVVAKSDEEQSEARKVMLYGIIVLFVMVSVWGLVNLLGDTLGLDSDAVPRAPDLPR